MSSGNLFVQLKPIRDLDGAKRVHDAAEKDGHRLLMPTHAAVKGDVVVGAVTLAGAPIVAFWSHSQSATPRDTLAVWQQSQALLAERCPNGFAVLCTPDSPLREYLERVGGTKVGSADIYWMPASPL
jgi:predicted GTPase